MSFRTSAPLLFSVLLCLCRVSTAHTAYPRRILVLVHRCSESVWRAGVPPDSTLPSPTPPATRGSPAVLPICSMRMTWETTRAELNASPPEVRCTTTTSIRPVSPARLEKSGPLPVRPVPRPRSRHTELKTSCGKSVLLRPHLRYELALLLFSLRNLRRETDSAINVQAG